MFRVLSKNWTSWRVIELKVLHRSLFVFYFEDDSDMDGVLRKTSWCFGNSLLALKKIEPTPSSMLWYVSYLDSILWHTCGLNMWDNGSKQRKLVTCWRLICSPSLVAQCNLLEWDWWVLMPTSSFLGCGFFEETYVWLNFKYKQLPNQV